MTLPEAAPLLNVSRVTVWRYVKIGKLKAVQFGNIFLVSEKDVNILAEARKGGKK